MATKRSGSPAHNARAARSGKPISDKDINFSDIPESTGEELARARKSDAIRFLEKLTGGPVTLGRFLEAVRLGEEMAQPEFAKKLGISKSHLNDIEKGRRSAGPDRAARFAKILGYSPEQLVKFASQDLVNRGRLKLQVFVKTA